MNYLNLQKHLKDNDLSSLQQDPYNLIVREDGNLVLFKYNIYESNFKLPIVREARGVILEKDSWDLVCLGFNKFFNLDEELSPNLDFNKCKVFRKYDGSLIKIYYYKGWKIATNGIINANDATIKYPVDPINTFQDAVFDIIGNGNIEHGKNIFNTWAKKLNKDNTYLFEIVHKQNPIVEEPKMNRLYYIGKRNVNNLLDFDVSGKFVNLNNTETVKTFQLDNLNENSIKEFAEHKTKDEVFEGFVVGEIEDGVIKNRIKLKTSVYLKYHRLTNDKHADNIFVEVFHENEMDEFEAYLYNAPDFAKRRYYELKQRYQNYINKLDKVLEKWQKHFDVVKGSYDNYETIFGQDVQQNAKEKYQKFIFEYVYRNKTPKEIIGNSAVKKLKDELIKEK